MHHDHGGGGKTRSNDSSSDEEDAAAAAAPCVQATIVAKWDETPTVQGLRLRVASAEDGAAAPAGRGAGSSSSTNNAAFQFRAGQWVDFWVRGIKPAGGFSIVTTPAELREAGTFDLGVKATRHPVAAWVAERAAAGDRVTVRAGGTFGLRPASLAPGGASLFVAGGIGVTPLVSMLTELVQRWAAAEEEEEQEGGRVQQEEGQQQQRQQAPLRAVLLYSARAPEEFALLRRLLDLQAAARGRLRVRLHCSAYAGPASAGSGGGGGSSSSGVGGGGIDGGGSGIEADAATAAEQEPGPRRPMPILLRGGAQSLTRRRVVASDLRAAVEELKAAEGATTVTAYVCGPPALADAAVGCLEAESGVESVEVERWW